MADPAAFWDKIAPKYAKSPVQDEAAYEHTLARSVSYLTATDHVLELGCGTGSTALRLAPYAAQFHATDLSQGMIQIAKDKPEGAAIPGLTFTCTDAQSALSKQPEPLDVIFAHSLLHLVPSVQRVLHLSHAALKPGGLFISKTPCLKSAKFPMRQILPIMIPIMRLFGKAPPVTLFSIEDLQAMITEAGFEILEEIEGPASVTHHYVVARAVQK